MSAALRSTLFALALLAVTPPYAVVALATFPLPRLARYRVISGWSRLVIALARSILGIRWRVEGRENLPARPAVILAKHQSAWETMAFQLIFPPQVHVLKRELLWIPFFGWGLALMSPIAIDRSRGLAALRAIARRGRERLGQGFWVIVFPEGTRVAPGERRDYQLGGAWLAAESGAPVVPVAHNAGLLWPRNAFLKRPGTVTVRIGPTIESADRDPKTINALAEQWIEEQQRALCPRPTPG
jgi:1-acyl-sn-glycerol-3-phosphate acyltransferase